MERASYASLREKSIPGRETSKCKGPEVGVSTLGEGREMSVTGAEWGDTRSGR